LRLRRAMRMRRLATRLPWRIGSAVAAARGIARVAAAVVARAARRTVVGLVQLGIAGTGVQAGEAFDLDPIDAPLEQPLGRGERLHFLAVDQRNGEAFAACAAGAADAVHIVLRDVRQLVV